MASNRKRTTDHLERSTVPTKERQQKPDFENTQDGKRVKADILYHLRKKDQLTSEVEGSITSWVRDYIFSEENYADPKIHIPSNDEEDKDFEKGDAATRLLMRNIAGERIKIVRLTIGTNFHNDLVDMLVRGFSFKALAQKLWPGRTDPRLYGEVAQHCATLLICLHGIYQKAVIEQKQLNNKNGGFLS